MMSHIDFRDELTPLLSELIEGGLSAAQFERLGQILEANAAARAIYQDHLSVHAMLYWRWHQKASDEQHESMGEGIDKTITGSPIQRADLQPSSLPLTIPTPSFLGNTFSSALGYLSSDWLVSYLVAAVIFGVGSLITSHIYISPSKQIADNSPSTMPASVPAVIHPERKLVGQVTSLVDCRWSNSHTATDLGHRVAAGDEFAIASGLVEITYDTGAKVLLQGPVTYQVDSPRSGFLSVGKLTARVEKKAVSGPWSVASGQKSNPQSTIPNPPLFAVRTPTAVVTDLGTEFGVEVSDSGETCSHVFRGSVQLQQRGVAEGEESLRNTIILHANEAASVKIQSSDMQNNEGKSSVPVDSKETELALSRSMFNATAFVRRVPLPRPKDIDLLDIVAYGDGTGNQRECGIDPMTGLQDPTPAPNYRVPVESYPGKYHPVIGQSLIDGVFVPNGADGPVMLDSAGHTFNGFPRTSGMAFSSIWSRAADLRIEIPQEKFYEYAGYWMHMIGKGDRYMPEQRGMLALHANVGITFSLEALRKTHPAIRPVRFRAVAAVLEVPAAIDTAHPDVIKGCADFWVLVDGRLMLKQMHVRSKNGLLPVNVAIGPNDRFLTIVVTDGGDGINRDWAIMGDPHLEIQPSTPEVVVPKAKE
jgi:hypothetical protein